MPRGIRWSVIGGTARTERLGQDDGVKHGLQLPPFGPLADAGALVEIGIAAEERGWDGVFLWDHILSPVGGAWEIADCWTALTAIGTVTRRLQLGPVVTPLPRRRVTVLAQQAVTLDHLTRGRLILGLGSGSDRG